MWEGGREGQGQVPTDPMVSVLEPIFNKSLHGVGLGSSWFSDQGSNSCPLQGECQS